LVGSDLNSSIQTDSKVRRPRFDQAAGKALEQAVRDLEKNTTAEVVVVVRGLSGTYRHADYLFGALVALVGLVFILFSPFDIHVYWVPFDVIGLFVVGAFVCSRGSLLRRLLTTETFRADAVRTGAAALFYDAGIANTHAETGLLVYLSLLERRLEVVADHGILRAVPPLKWNHAVFDLKQVALDPRPEKLIKATRVLGCLLAECLPASREHRHELSNSPRIELK
jgi:putative membrane protein